MTTFTAFNKIDGGLTANFTTPDREHARRWTAGLFVSALLGSVSGLAGLVLGLLTYLALITSSTATYTTSTMLIGASFILFGLAAHCLDKSDAADKAMRLEYCRQHGLRDDCDAKQNAE